MRIFLDANILFSVAKTGLGRIIPQNRSFYLAISELLSDFAVMIQRANYHRMIVAALKRSPICALLGPRQCGKTTLARAIAAEGDSQRGLFLGDPG